MIYNSVKLLVYVCFLFEIDSLQPYPSRLMRRGLISVTYFYHAFRVVVYQHCYFGMELPHTSLLPWDSS